MQKIFPQWEIVKHLGAVVPWPNPPDGALQFYRDVAIPQMERGEGWHWTLRLKTRRNAHELLAKHTRKKPPLLSDRG